MEGLLKDESPSRILSYSIADSADWLWLVPYLVVVLVLLVLALIVLARRSGSRKSTDDVTEVGAQAQRLQGILSHEVGRQGASGDVAESAMPTVSPATEESNIIGKLKRSSRFGRTYLYAECNEQGGREYSEDTERVRLKGSSICAVVADGLGGHGGGDLASRMVTDIIMERYKPGMDEEDFAQVLEIANEALHLQQNEETKMRSTVVVLSLSNSQAVWANAGDSRLYHFVDSKLAWQTTDHSVSQMAVMLGQISSDMIRLHEDRSRLLKALGQEGELKPDTGVIDLARGTRNAFLLCTDGFWEYVLEEEMERELAGASSPEEWLNRMLRLHATRRPQNCDNYSAIAIWQNKGGR